MPTEISTALRNASNRGVAANRKKDPLEFEEFLKEWLLRLGRKGSQWQGKRAVAELKRKKVFYFLLCQRESKPGWRAEDLFDGILDEMKEYRKETGQLAREAYDKTDDFLSRLARSVQKKKEGINVPGLKGLLSELMEEIEKKRKTVGWLKQRKKEWHYGVWQQLWSEIPRQNLVTRIIDLDTRLQVELGKMFSDYLRGAGVSLETIARVILLAYRVGGLAFKDGKVTRTYGTRRRLTVRNIRENLRYAGLHKAESFRHRRD
jgi:hypothetical protein